MDWDNVRVFLAVARGGQFVAAAKRLRLDHATVSRRIAALEATVGARLFDRRTTGAKLTGAGERFIGAAEQMESAFLHAQGEISGVDLELSGDVRIGASAPFAAGPATIQSSTRLSLAGVASGSWATSSGPPSPPTGGKTARLASSAARP